MKSNIRYKNNPIVSYPSCVTKKKKKECSTGMITSNFNFVNSNAMKYQEHYDVVNTNLK